MTISHCNQYTGEDPEQIPGGQVVEAHMAREQRQWAVEGEMEESEAHRAERRRGSVRRAGQPSSLHDEGHSTTCICTI